MSVEYTDAQARDMMIAAKIPSAYHDRKKGLSSLTTPNAALIRETLTSSAAQWRTTGGVVEFPYDGPEAMDELYYFTRGLLFNYRLSPVILPLPILGSMLELRTLGEELEQRHCLVIPDFMGNHYKAPQPETLFSKIEWVVRQWIENNGLVVLQGECPLELCEWWRYSFKRVLLSRCVFRVPSITPTVKVKR